MAPAHERGDVLGEKLGEAVIRQRASRRALVETMDEVLRLALTRPPRPAASERESLPAADDVTH